jgi:hypothetical protein
LSLFLLLTWATKGERKRRKEEKMGGGRKKNQLTPKKSFGKHILYI